LYYLSLPSINKIYNYINKSEQLLTFDEFSSINEPGEKFDYLKSSQNNLNKNNPYSSLLCLGSFLNTNIYTFTHHNSAEKNIMNLKASPQVKLNPLLNNPTKDYLKPKIKTIVKIIKYLSATFPNYSTEFFTYHLYSRSGINSVNTPSKAMSRKDKNYLQIQLTEIKSHLNKKKLKNLEVKKSIVSNKTNKSNNTSSFNSHTFTNNNIKIKNININTSIKKNTINSIHSINFNSFRSYQVNHNHSKTTASNPLYNTKFTSKNSEPKFNSQVNKNYQKLKDAILTDSNEICNSHFSSHPKFNDTTETQNTGNSKIYVVARDSNLRFKTELEESQESSFDCEDEQEQRANITISEECYNTPTKKKVLRYYS
jgi:hypothetical protein